MKTSPSLIALLLAALAVPACSSSDANTDETHSEGAGGSGGDGGGDAGSEEDAGEEPEEDAGAGGSGGAGGGSPNTCGSGAPICSDVDQGFDEEEPGFFATFDLGVTLMMGNRIGLVAGTFQQTAREDYCKEPESTIPLDTCVVVDPSDAPAPQCSSDEQCSPEQKCLPRTRDGQPIACTEHCQTPRSLLDIGPIEITGFTDGPLQLESNPDQSDAYVPPGNGTVDPSKFAFATTYVIKGDGDPEQGVSSFEAEVELGPELAITSPELEQVEADMGIPGFPPFPVVAMTVDPDAELTLKWTGAVADGELSLELTAADVNASRGHIKCRVKDDGEFTIPAEMIEALDLGDSAFFNNLNVERITKGTLTGDSFTRYEINSRQVLIVNMAKKEAEDAAEE